MPLGEVTRLQPGDILPLSNGAEIPVTLEVEGRAHFTGRVGRRQRKRAVEITAVIDGGGAFHV
jgi:flagellar motor switch protein FliM